MTGIGTWVTKRSERTPEAIALIDGATGRTLDYRALHDNSASRASALRDAGVRRGDRIAIVSANSIEMLETMFAASLLGAVFVPVNYRLSPAEVAYILSDARPTIVVHDSMFAELAIAGAALAGNVPVAHFDTVTGDGAQFTANPVHADDLAMIMYTSGTTGRPKGAMLTHGNFEANAVNMLTAGSGLTRKDVTIASAPLFHIGALGLYTMPLLFAGGTVVIQQTFDPAKTLELIAEHGVTVQFLVPAMWDAVSRVASFDDTDLSSLRALLCGGAPCPLTVIDFFQGKGLTFLEGFGMTELSPTALVLEADFVRSHAGSVGRPFMGIDVRIVDDQDRDVPTGEVGELVLRGDNVFVGYWGLPEATAEAKRGGWFHSGDLARKDDDGFVTLVDRKKDMVVTGGENVYPIEVEQVLFQHPDIQDAAVIGLPDTRWGESVTAVVVLRDGAQPDGDALIAFCREHIAGFKCPKRVEFMEALPRNATGKLLKANLRKEFSGSASAVSR